MLVMIVTLFVFAGDERWRISAADRIQATGELS